MEVESVLEEDDSRLDLRADLRDLDVHDEQQAAQQRAQRALRAPLRAGLVGGFTDRVMVDKASPNHGIKLSRKNSLAAFLVTWLTGGLIAGPLGGLTREGPIVGLIAGAGRRTDLRVDRRVDRRVKSGGVQP